MCQELRDLAKATQGGVTQMSQASTFPFFRLSKKLLGCPVMSHCTTLITADRSWNHLEADEV